MAGRIEPGQDDEDTTSGQEEPETVSRRQALKTLAAATGAAALSSLPPRWVKPVVQSSTLPAFAQASPTPTPIPTSSPLGTGDLQVLLTWDAGDVFNRVDVDIHVVEPDGTRIYFANRVGPTARLEVDNIVGFGPENIFVLPGEAAPGTYRAQIVYYEGTLPTVATIRITVFDSTAQQQTATFTRSLTTADRLTAINVADITFPSGIIQEVTGTAPIPLAGSAGKGDG